MRARVLRMTRNAMAGGGRDTSGMLFFSRRAIFSAPLPGLPRLSWHVGVIVGAGGTPPRPPPPRAADRGHALYAGTVDGRRSAGRPAGSAELLGGPGDAADSRRERPRPARAGWSPLRLPADGRPRSGEEDRTA